MEWHDSDLISDFGARPNPMKLVVQIPCLNEEATLAQTIADIPRAIPGIDVVEILIIDDGSTDRTIEVAREAGADYVVRHMNNRGLARAFRTGIDAALKLDADIIVNTDADNQYHGPDIARLVQPILEGQAEIVVGDRQTGRIAHFSPLKKLLQRLGSAVVRQLSETDVPDVVSGFRAISREAALKLNILSPFSYTIEMVIQAGKKHLSVTSVPVSTNAKTRDSRLFTSIPKFIERQVTTIVRMYAMYQPLRVFFFTGAVATLLGLIPIIRFMYAYFTAGGAGHMQSLLLGAVLVMIGALAFALGMLADLISFNRQLIEMTLERVRRMELTESTTDLPVGVQKLQPEPSPVQRSHRAS